MSTVILPQTRLEKVNLYSCGCTQPDFLSAFDQRPYWAKRYDLQEQREFRGTYKVSWNSPIRPSPGVVLEVFDDRNEVVWTHRIMATKNLIGVDRGDFNFVVGGYTVTFVLYDVRMFTPCGLYPQPHAQLRALLEMEHL